MISYKTLIYVAICVAIGAALGWLLGREFGDVRRGLEIGVLLGVLAGFARDGLMSGDGGVYAHRCDGDGGTCDAD